jgi:SDR family mycofactocin-dependent oxidoreductase
MAGKVEGKVAIVTGAARGQGRVHALTLASEGATVVLLDVPGQLATLPYPAATARELDATVAEVRAISADSYGVEVDVRDRDGLREAIDDAAAKLGRLDILVGNHGVVSYVEIVDMSDDAWHEVIDVNLTGTFNCAQAVLPHMVKGDSGVIVATASNLARQGMTQLAHYVASKWALLGFVKTLALELAPHNIRVNALLPTTVNTPMIMHDAMYRLFRPDLEHPTAEDMVPILSSLNALDIPWIEPEDTANAMLYLVSDEGRYVTGGGLDVAAGWNARQSA